MEEVPSSGGGSWEEGGERGVEQMQYLVAQLEQKRSRRLDWI